jgi:hypothetical protein
MPVLQSSGHVSLLLEMENRTMEMLSKNILRSTVVLFALAGLAGMPRAVTAPAQPCQPTWNSLKKWHTPQRTQRGEAGWADGRDHVPGEEHLFPKSKYDLHNTP